MHVEMRPGAEARVPGSWGIGEQPGAPLGPPPHAASRPPVRPAVLYQEYSDVASARELRRQQREEEGPGDEAEGAEEGPGPPRANLSPSSSFRAQRSTRGSTFSLWQDIPDVRGSGVLATLSLRACKLQEVSPGGGAPRGPGAEGAWPGAEGAGPGRGSSGVSRGQSFRRGRPGAQSGWSLRKYGGP